MTGRSTNQSSDAQKKPAASVEIPVEVLGAEAPHSKSSSGGGIPKGAFSPGGISGKSDVFKAMASLAVAVAADSLEAAMPPAWVIIDAFTTLAFFLIWGLRWEIAVVLLPELVPGMNVFPSWTLLAIYLGKKGTANRQV
jgi:hypothetical protein